MKKNLDHIAAFSIAAVLTLVINLAFLAAVVYGVARIVKAVFA